MNLAGYCIRNDVFCMKIDESRWILNWKWWILPFFANCCPMMPTISWHFPGIALSKFCACVCDRVNTFFKRKSGFLIRKSGFLNGKQDCSIENRTSSPSVPVRRSTSVFASSASNSAIRLKPNANGGLSLLLVPSGSHGVLTVMPTLQNSSFLIQESSFVIFKSLVVNTKFLIFNTKLIIFTHLVISITTGLPSFFVIKSTFLNRKSTFFNRKSTFFNRKSGFFHWKLTCTSSYLYRFVMLQNPSYLVENSHMCIVGALPSSHHFKTRPDIHSKRTKSAFQSRFDFSHDSYLINGLINTTNSSASTWFYTKIKILD